MMSDEPISSASSSSSSSSSSSLKVSSATTMDARSAGHARMQTGMTALFKTVGLQPRPGQVDVVHALVQEKSDVFAMLPCGGGKTHTFFISLMLLGGVGVMVVPLKTISRSHMTAARDFALSLGKMYHWEYLNLVDPSVASKAQAWITEDVPAAPVNKLGTLRVIIASPEMVNHLYKFNDSSCFNRVTLFCVDEAHLVLWWGTLSFRRKFKNLGSAISPDALLLALSASAAPTERSNIMRILRGNSTRKYVEVVCSPRRVDLAFTFVEAGMQSLERTGAVAKYITQHHHSLGIVFVEHVKGIDRAKAMVREELGKTHAGARVLIMGYHSGLPSIDQQLTQSWFARCSADNLELEVASSKIVVEAGVEYVEFAVRPACRELMYVFVKAGDMVKYGTKVLVVLKASTSEVVCSLPDSWRPGSENPLPINVDLRGVPHTTCAVIISTVGFTTGIDIPGVRWAVACSMPTSLSQMYQFASRAGRDESTADVLIFFSWRERLLSRQRALKARDAASGSDADAARGELSAIDAFYAAAWSRGTCRHQLIEFGVSGKVFSKEVCAANAKCDVCAAQAVSATKGFDVKALEQSVKGTVTHGGHSVADIKDIVYKANNVDKTNLATALKYWTVCGHLCDTPPSSPSSAYGNWIVTPGPRFGADHWDALSL